MFAPAAASASPQLAGGATTTFDQSINALSLPASNLSLERQDEFYMGAAFFKKPWVIAPASTTARDGLGPLFNANSCLTCHPHNGRGQPPDLNTPLVSVQIQLGREASTPEEKALAQQLGTIPDPVYGQQLQPLGIPGLKGEATPYFDYETLIGQFKDGESYTLLKPKLRLESLNYGALAADTQFSARVAPALIGLGLIAHIADADILALADPDDANQDGISGRANRVWDRTTQTTSLGRFGLKSNQPSLKQQIATAFRNDLGISSELSPEQPCSPAQTLCLSAPAGGTPEITDTILDKVVFYTALLATPARRQIDTTEVIQGERLFQQIGCANCHHPQFTTHHSARFPELGRQTIYPYTDLLLHDMGEDLADQRSDFQASGREWRTAPLWGLGLLATINGHQRLLHDGRARSIMEAILWHGGEAQAAQQAVLKLSKPERTWLLRFLESL